MLLIVWFFWIACLSKDRHISTSLQDSSSCPVPPWKHCLLPLLVSRKPHHSHSVHILIPWLTHTCSLSAIIHCKLYGSLPCMYTVQIILICQIIFNLPHPANGFLLDKKRIHMKRKMNIIDCDIFLQLQIQSKYSVCLGKWAQHCFHHKKYFY